MKSYNFLFWAYNVIWAGIAIWIFVIFNRTRRLDRRVEAMEREIDKRQP